MSVEVKVEERLAPPPLEIQQEVVAKATALIALGNILSRVLGLGREIILSNLFGASAAVDAFKIAIIIPRGLYDLLIGGHVNSALVPVLSEYAARRDEANLWALVNALLSLCVLVMSLLVLVLTSFAPALVRLIASPLANPQTLEDATHLLQITAPALFFLALFAVLSSLLYAMQKFSAPALAASVFNLTIIGVTALFAQRWGITAVAFGWLAGAFVQMVLQVWGLRYESLRWRVRLWHSGIPKIGLLYAPVMFSLALDVLVNRPFSYNLAARTGEGNIAYMDWATTLIQFPHGLVATAISVAVLPTLARQAALHLGAFKDTLGLGLRLTLALIAPASVGLFVFATPIVALIFEHGAFTAYDTDRTALALRLYLLGLPFASLDLLLVFAFYARQDTLTPALIGLFSLGVYMVTALVLLPRYGFFALMLADSMKHIVHAGVSWWFLMRRVEGLRGQRLLSTGLKASFAALLMGLLGAGLLVFLRHWFAAHTLSNELVLVLGAGGLSGAFYLFLAHQLGLREVTLFFQQIRQRL
jgi:putative peptidoglycan lipid II flippase